MSVEEGTGEEKAVSMDTIHRLVRRLANQLPTQYYLDGKHNASFSHCKIAIWTHASQVIGSILMDDMAAAGFTYIGTEWLEINHLYKHTWIAKRADTDAMRY